MNTMSNKLLHETRTSRFRERGVSGKYMKRILTVLIIAALSCGLGIGYEGIFYMFDDTFQYSEDGGETFQSADTPYIVESYIEGFVQGVLWSTILIPFIIPIILIAKRIEKKSLWHSLAFLLGGTAYGICLSVALALIFGGWGLYGIYGSTGYFGIGALASSILLSASSRPQNTNKSSYSTSGSGASLRE